MHATTASIAKDNRIYLITSFLSGGGVLDQGGGGEAAGAGSIETDKVANAPA